MSQTDTTTPTAPGDVPGSHVRGSRHLQGRLGTFSLIFIVVAAAAPLTVIGGNVALTVASGNGVGAPAGFLIIALVLLVFAVGYVTMTPHVKEPGAYYAYIRAAFGQHSGTAAAFLAFVTYTAIEIGIYGFFGGSTAAFVEAFGGPVLPWWVWAVLAWIVVAVLGLFSIDFSSKVLGVLMVFEIGIVLVLDAAVLFQGGAEGITLTTFAPAHVFQPTIGVAILFALTGCIGFEATAVFRDEAKDPARTIPRATYGAVLLIGIYYAVSSWLLVLAWGPSHAVEEATTNSGGFMLDAMQVYAGTTMRHIMDVFLVTSLFACVLSLHNIATRYQFTLATEGYLHRVFTRVHTRFGSPFTSSLGQSGVALCGIVAFAVFDVDPLAGVFGAMAGVATTGFLVLLVSTSLAVVWFFRDRPDLAASVDPLKSRVLPALAALLLLACLVIAYVNFGLITAAPAGVSVFLALIPPATAVFGYVFSRRRARLASRAAEVPSPRS
ncbi:APC family permease [Brevibacterium litoralis]|uniref:APC family permease n=1 Tax=Brevibacterium litoralis TaxID=3138935 RepID=UPI0032ED4C68